MGDITLSFCITTRNREPYIGTTLENIVSQATDEVEIVVLDAASADGTRETVEGFARRFPLLRYFRQDTNEGVDRDYDRTVELARGKYCWMMSDDDALTPGAVAEVLGHCREGLDLIVVNAEDRDAGLGEILGERRLPFTEDRLYRPSDTDRLFSEAAHHLSFIPSVVIRRDLWLSRARAPYFGSLFVHVGVIFQDRLPGNALVVSRPLVSVRNANVSWAARSFEIWMFKWPALVWSFGGISVRAREAVTPLEPWKGTKALLTYRAMAAYSLEEYRRWIAPVPASPFRKALAWAIGAAPGRMVNALAMLYCFLFLTDGRIPRFNLSNSRFHPAGGRKETRR
jgi:abequosyltransferase